MFKVYMRLMCDDYRMTNGPNQLRHLTVRAVDARRRVTGLLTAVVADGVELQADGLHVDSVVSFLEFKQFFFVLILFGLL